MIIPVNFDDPGNAGFPAKREYPGKPGTGRDSRSIPIDYIYC